MRSLRIERATCDSCRALVPALRLRRLVWARVCPACAERLEDQHSRELALPPTLKEEMERAIRRREASGGSTWSAAALSPREVARLLLPRGVLYALVIGACAALGGGTAAFLRGALWADTLAWVFLGMLLAPFRGFAFAVELALAGCALTLAGGASDEPLAGLPGAAATCGFFLVLFAHALRIGLHFADVRDAET